MLYFYCMQNIPLSIFHKKNSRRPQKMRRRLFFIENTEGGISIYLHSSSSKTLRLRMYGACVFVKSQMLRQASYLPSDCGE